jgi:hypothetical protein
MTHYPSSYPHGRTRALRAQRDISRHQKRIKRLFVDREKRKSSEPMHKQRRREQQRGK